MPFGRQNLCKNYRNICNSEDETRKVLTIRISLKLSEHSTIFSVLPGSWIGSDIQHLSDDPLFSSEKMLSAEPMLSFSQIGDKSAL